MHIRLAVLFLSACIPHASAPAPEPPAAPSGGMAVAEADAAAALAPILTSFTTTAPSVVQAISTRPGSGFGNVVIHELAAPLHLPAGECYLAVIEAKDDYRLTPCTNAGVSVTAVVHQDPHAKDWISPRYAYDDKGPPAYVTAEFPALPKSRFGDQLGRRTVLWLGCPTQPIDTTLELKPRDSKTCFTYSDRKATEEFHRSGLSRFDPMSEFQGSFSVELFAHRLSKGQSDRLAHAEAKAGHSAACSACYVGTVDNCTTGSLQCEHDLRVCLRDNGCN